jgi:hypothetical protein
MSHEYANPMIHDEHGPAAPAPHSPSAAEDGQDVTGEPGGDPLAETILEALEQVGRADLATALHIANALRESDHFSPVALVQMGRPEPDFVTVPNPALAGTKPSNPKDALGILKVALSCVSWPVLMEVGVGMLEGALKYGRHNYRVVGVRASVYVDATLRHVGAFWEGEDEDPESAARLSHITKAITSLTVLRDSMIAGNWVDDRPPVTAPKGWLNALNDKVRALLAQYPNPVPPYTQAGQVAALFEEFPETEALADLPSESPSEVG